MKADVKDKLLPPRDRELFCGSTTSSHCSLPLPCRSCSIIRNNACTLRYGANCARSSGNSGPFETFKAQRRSCRPRSYQRLESLLLYSVVRGGLEFLWRLLSAGPTALLRLTLDLASRAEIDLDPAADSLSQPSRRFMPRASFSVSWDRSVLLFSKASR